MSIAPYLKEIGRGAKGARPLSREQAADLLGQVLDGRCSELEVGAFCIAMRIKGETAEEMAGFLDATEARLQKLPAASRPVVVLPSYNGARKLPVLTPLLAGLLARKGLPVLIHGMSTEDARVSSRAVMDAVSARLYSDGRAMGHGGLHFVPTEQLLPGLARLLDARRRIGLRNPAHSLVKLMNPVAGRALVVSSYTHPEYAESMTATLALTRGNALLLRGTEGEPVADARRTPRMDLFLNGVAECVQAAQTGSLSSLPDLPASIDAASTAAYIIDVMEGRAPAPVSIVRQVEHITRACKLIEGRDDPAHLHPLTS